MDSSAHPVLNQALGFKHQLPARKAADETQVLHMCPGLEFIIDGSERPIQRPKDKQRQREYYSSKKKRHMVKNVTIGDLRTRKIIALSRTRPGKTSDKRTANEEDYHFPARSKLWKDMGFQGYEPPNVRTYQPKKKPPKGELTAEEKASNQAIARQRVRIEHSIGGAKVFHIARDVFRNRRDEYAECRSLTKREHQERTATLLFPINLNRLRLLFWLYPCPFDYHVCHGDPQAPSSSLGGCSH
jgi:hypothetical protein